MTEPAAYDPYKYALIELDGNREELDALRKLAPACNCELRPGPGGALWLGSDKFDDAQPFQAQEKASEILTTLNGLARLEKYDHRPVTVGNEFFKKNRQMHFYGEPRQRKRGSIGQYFVPPGVDPFPGPIPETDATRRAARIASDQRLVDVVRPLADEVNWQKLRVAFERITAFVGRSGNDDNALVRQGYATQPELDRLKANIQDPRLSGINAVHGTHGGHPPKGSKMTEKEGLDFVVRLLDDYLRKNPA